MLRKAGSLSIKRKTHFLKENRKKRKLSFKQALEKVKTDFLPLKI